MIFPIKFIAIAAFLSYIVIIISCILPMRKVSKAAPIDLIRRTSNDFIKSKQMRVPKIIERLFGQEGELAYKNIKKDKSRYKTIVMSIVISIVLFISVSRLLEIMLYQYGESQSKYKETICRAELWAIEPEKKEAAVNKITNYLKEKDLINKYINIDRVTTVHPAGIELVVPKDKVTEGAKILEKNDVISLYEEGEKVQIGVCPIVVRGQDYDNILKSLGIKELKLRRMYSNRWNKWN